MPNQEQIDSHGEENKIEGKISQYMPYGAIALAALGVGYAYSQATKPTLAGESSSSLFSFLSNLNFTIFGRSEKNAILQTNDKGAIAAGLFSFALGAASYSFWETSHKARSSTPSTAPLLDQSRRLEGGVTVDHRGRIGSIQIGDNHFGDSAGKPPARPK